MIGTMIRNTKRVMRDFKQLVDDGPANGIWIKQVNPDNLDLFYIMLVGPKGPYEGSLFFFTLEPWVTYTGQENLSGHTYPATPPKILHQSPWSIRAHPNLYHTGGDFDDRGRVGGAKVCLSILGTWQGPSWTPMYSFMSIFQSILMILDNEPLRNEPCYECGKNDIVAGYSKYIQYVCLRETFERTFLPVMSGKTDNIPYLKLFENEIKQIWLDKCDWYNTHAQTLEQSNTIVQKSLAYYGDVKYVGESYKFDVLDKLNSFNDH
jgi:ubiquitin-protein ligase